MKRSLLQDISISGTGIIDAANLSKNTKLPVIFVFDKNKSGKIVRLGYYLEYKNPDQRNIHWLDIGEYQIKYSKFPVSKKSNPSLHVDFKDPKKANERQFLIAIPLSKTQSILVRLIFRVLPSADRTFVLQTEYKEKSKHTTLVRYDCAHGFIHKDIYKAGKQIKKITIDIQDYKVAISTGIKEIREELSGIVVAESLKHPEVTKAFDQARNRIIKLIASNYISYKNTQSNLTVLGDEVKVNLKPKK